MSDVIRVGIAGLGRSGWGIHARLLEPLNDLYQVVAAADVDEGRQQEMINRFGCRAYSDISSLIQDPEVELVVNALPSHLHPSGSIEALEAGKHVVCEKPMAIRVSDADQMMDAARKADRLLAIFQIRRYAADFQKVQEIIASGKLGRIVMIRLAWQGFGRRWDWQTLQRYDGGSLNNVPLMRKVYTKVGNRVLQFLMPVRLSTYTGMTRAYRRDVIQCLDLQSDGKELHLEIISKLGALGYQIGEIPAALTWPEGRKSRRSTFRPWRYIVSHLVFGIGEAPLLLLGVAGLFLIALGIMLGIYLLTLSISGTPVGGRPLVPFSALSILVGFFTLLFGFLAGQNKQLERQLHRLQREMRKRNESSDSTIGHEDVRSPGSDR